MTVRDHVHLGVADHLGWAVVVAVSTDSQVLDRRRIELVGPDLPAAPVHHHGGVWDLHGSTEPPTDHELASLVEAVRTSSAATIDAELDRLVADLGAPVVSLSLRSWPADFPTDIGTQRQVPHESRADPVMYRRTLAAAAERRAWLVVTYEARTVEAAALAALTGRGAADGDLLAAPRRTLGAPWAKDHRLAYAAAIMAASIGAHGRETRR